MNINTKFLSKLHPLDLLVNLIPYQYRTLKIMMKKTKKPQHEEIQKQFRETLSANIQVFVDTTKYGAVDLPKPFVIPNIQPKEPRTVHVQNIEEITTPGGAKIAYNRI
ncbi:MAG: hypothetical protein Q7S57_04065 [bacterium]|nr:hypothetical protein [bacterium]